MKGKPVPRKRWSKINMFHMNENVVVRNEMKEVDFDTLVDNGKPREKSVNSSKEITDLDTDKNSKEKVIKKLLNTVKSGFTYILSWGL